MAAAAGKIRAEVQRARKSAVQLRGLQNVPSHTREGVGLIEKAQERMQRINLELAIEDREVMAEAMFPTEAVLEALHKQNSQPTPEPPKESKDNLIIIAKR
jgi:hypothetical protein